MPQLLEVATKPERLATRWHDGTDPCPNFTAFYTRAEIQRSWGFLFREGTRCAAYQALGAPSSVSISAVPKTRFWYKLSGLRSRSNNLGHECRWPISMKVLLSKWPASFPETRLDAARDPFTDLDGHLWGGGAKKAIKKHKELAYDAFTVYEQRLRYLRKHMDDCKPKDFWGLVYDRRNTLQYYTFWSVIAVGFLSILLGLMSLAVGIAQAVFAYRALNLPVAAITTNSTT